MAEVIRPLYARDIVAPLLPSLPGAAIASEPATAVLPLLSPILRQRVQFLSASSSEPWIRLLSYDSSKAAKLVEVARSTRLEPHPLSGEIEIDWDSNDGDAELRYKRLDVETLQALVFLRDLDMVFRLVYCEGDQEGGGNGWRVGEVSIPDKPHAFATFGGFVTLSEAEQAFADAQAKKEQSNGTSHHHTTNHSIPAENGDDDDDDDDDYWARYDATPARTPAVKRSPAPGAGPTQSHLHHHHHNHHTIPNTHATSQHSAEAEDAYFAQYDSVQPAMDNHDPDEVVEAPVAASVPPPLGLSHLTAAQTLERSVNGINVDGHDAVGVADHQLERERLESLLHHPRPASASSNSSSAGSAAVAKLEESAGKREQSEFGVKQHVSRSIKSLFMLARASGIDREEFEQLVKTELDMLALMED